MNDQQFRDEVMRSLGSIDTKLDSLPAMRTDIDSLKLSRARDRGMVAGISLAVSVAFAAAKAALFGR